MANVVKIKDVTFYLALTEDIAECHKWKKLLDSSGIKYTFLPYLESYQFAENLAALSTWAWGPKHEVRPALTKYPVITWNEWTDDFETYREYATTMDGLLELLAKRDIIS